MFNFWNIISANCERVGGCDSPFAMDALSNLILESMSEAVLLLDEDGYIQYANPAAVLLTGYQLPELLSHHISILYHNDTIKSDYDLTVCRSKGTAVVEGWKYKANETAWWAELTYSAVKDEDVVAGFTCVIRDVTARKNEELEIRKSEERYRLMVEGVRDYAIFMLDTTGHIVTWNEGAKRTKGYSSYEIIGKHFSIFYTKEDLEDGKPERELRIAVATGKYEEEGWRIKKNGSVFWANIVITALFNEQNQHIGFSKVTRDLTERRDNEELLRQSEERYRSLIEQVADYGIFLLDEKGRIVSWNEGAKKLNGYSADEVIGKYFSIFYPEEDIRNGKPPMELRVAKQEGKYEEEGWRLRKDGSAFWANVLITSVYDKQGHLIGFSKVTRDLTERKANEKALRESYDRYRRLSTELQEINNELTYANNELEQFTSIVSHDLQEPIRTIKSFLTLIEMQINDGKYDNLPAYISKSINASVRMQELIRNLLQYAQLSKYELKEEPINVREMINEAAANLKSAIEQSGAELVVSSDVEQIVGDKVQLMQLVQNLVSNAIKFTRRQVPRVEISCEQNQDHSVTFSIRDNGIGIENSDAEKVFEIFKRLNTEKEYPGTGIGLAICKKIVDRHGGRIWMDSTPGEGTTFYFTLKQDVKEGVVAV